MAKIVSITLLTGKTYKVGEPYDDSSYIIARIEYTQQQRVYQIYPNRPQGVITIPANQVDPRRTVRR